MVDELPKEDKLLIEGDDLSITDMVDIKARWKEHFCNLLKQAVAYPHACNMIQPRDTREELSIPITDLELKKALKTTRSCKAPGHDSS